MLNTRMITQEVEYFDPTSLQEALHLLDRYGGDAKVIAGGTDLLVQMKLETVWSKVLISIKKIPELQILADGKGRSGAQHRLADDGRRLLHVGEAALEVVEAPVALGLLRLLDRVEDPLLLLRAISCWK